LLRMVSGSAVQTKGLGSALWSSMKRLIAAWRSIDRAEHAASKNGKPTAVALSSRARSALAELPRSIDGRLLPFSISGLRDGWLRATKRAGSSGLRWHDLRHEAVSRLFEKGVTTEEVMQMSGHRTYAMLFRYTHLRTETLAAKLG
jgi:integrase